VVVTKAVELVSIVFISAALVPYRVLVLHHFNLCFEASKVKLSGAILSHCIYTVLELGGIEPDP